MNHSTKQGLFPGFSILTGLVGFVLQCWLLSAVDDRGLFPNNHIAGILCYVLLALTLAVCWMETQKIFPRGIYLQMFPPLELSAIGTTVGAIGIGYTAFTVECAGLMRFVLPALGVLSAGGLLVSARCRVRKQRPHFMCHGLMCIYVILHTLIGCKQWGTEPQILLFFFPLLASVFLLLACYYRAELDICTTDCRKYLFFGQAALFCCFLCLPGEDWLFYLSAGLWVATDFCKLPTENEE